MKTLKEFIAENAEAPVKVGQKVEVHYRNMSGKTIVRGEHTVTKVGKNHFMIDRPDAVDGKPMKFKHNGVGMDYKKAKSGRIKGISRSYGHYVKSITDTNSMKHMV